MPVFLDLFHGRTHPDEELDDWGVPGPVLGPFKWIHTTYGSDLKLGSLVEPEDAIGELSLWSGALAYYDGMFYGDWSIFSEDVLNEDTTGHLRSRLAQFEGSKAVMPQTHRTIPEAHPTLSKVDTDPEEPAPVFKLTIVSNELFEVCIPAASAEEAREYAERCTPCDLQNGTSYHNIDWHTGVVSVAEVQDADL